MGLTTLARLPLTLLEQVDETRLEQEELLRRAGLRLEDVADPDKRIPQDKLETLWQLVIESVPDPSIGIRFGQAMTAKAWGLVGYSMANSRRLLDALQRLVRYSRIVSEAVYCELDVDVERCAVTIAGPPELDVLERPADARLAAVLNLVRDLTRATVVPLEVHFPYARPADISAHQAYFKCPLVFGQPRALLVLQPSDPARRVSSADEVLGGYLVQLAEDTLESLGSEGSFSDRVRRAAWVNLSEGTPTLRDTARTLGVSARTLQRRLSNEHTTFAQLVDSLRHDMAHRLLQDRSHAIYEVAFLLGYSDTSTFHRAFRRWHGMTPSAFRRSLTV